LFITIYEGLILPMNYLPYALIYFSSLSKYMFAQ